MEILIPGLILVGFMVWASTRIKRNAARAYEEEQVENERFAITKPEGFISPAVPGEGLLFAAYSKDFGRDEADAIHLVAAEVTEHPAANIAEVRQRLSETTDLSEKESHEILGGRPVSRLTASKIVSGNEINEYIKLIETDAGVLQLRVSALAEQEEEFSGRIEVMLDSFRAV